MIGSRIVFAFLIVPLFASPTVASSSSILAVIVASVNAARSSSPIKNWESSHAASAAEGSAIILSFSHDSAICVMRRPQRRVLTSALSSSATNQHTWLAMDGLRVRQLCSDEWTRNTVNNRWHLLGNSVLCCMTGLSSDVDFLLRTHQKKIDTEQILYEGSQNGQFNVLLREFSAVLREATRWHDGRPYGVQVLLLGVPKSTTQPLSLYSLDPSGGFWKWPTATAIGKSAHLIRKHLSLLIQESEDMNGRRALAQVLSACCLAMEEASYSTENDNYEVLILKRVGDQLNVYVVHEEEMSNYFQTKSS